MEKGHKGCTSAGTDVRVDGTVKARVRHAIDRGEGSRSAQRRRTRSTVAREEKWGIDRKKK